MSQQEENESDMDSSKGRYRFVFSIHINFCICQWCYKLVKIGIQRKANVPTLFCGIHNPKRDDSFYGLYPGGEHLDGGALVIPRCLECGSVPES